MLELGYQTKNAAQEGNFMNENAHSFFSWFCDFSKYFNELTVNSIFQYQTIIHSENMKLFQRIWEKNIQRPEEWRCLLSEEYDCKHYYMSPEELKEYNRTQVEEIKKLKIYLEKSENKEYTMEEVIEIWSKKYSSAFRRYWHLKKMTEIL